MPGPVEPIGLVASLLLVGLAVAASLWQDLQVERQILWASLRALAQLLAVGVVLAFVLDPARSLAWSWAWVGLMVVFAGIVLRNRAPEVKGMLPIGLAAFAATAVVTLGVIFGLGIFPVESTAIVPIAGMMIGNSMNAGVVAARRSVEEIRDKRPEVEARLALGQPSGQASKPYVRAALRTALIPRIESTKAVGLVSLPGAMTGLILAGVDPIDAVLVQAAIMYLILGSSTIAATTVALGTTRLLFTKDHRLAPLPRAVS